MIDFKVCGARGGRARSADGPRRAAPMGRPDGPPRWATPMGPNVFNWISIDFVIISFSVFELILFVFELIRV